MKHRMIYLLRYSNQHLVLSSITWIASAKGRDSRSSTNNNSTCFQVSKLGSMYIYVKVSLILSIARFCYSDRANRGTVAIHPCIR